MTIIRYSALIIKDEFGFAQWRDTNVRDALVDSRGYRDDLSHQKCHSTSTRSWN